MPDVRRAIIVAQRPQQYHTDTLLIALFALHHDPKNRRLIQEEITRRLGTQEPVMEKIRRS